MWIQFDGKKNEPKACKVAIGKVNSITGKPWNQKFLKGEEQDYVVIPDQPWLDGINAGDGYIKQFVAMPLGGGYTVEAQVTGKEDVGGLQVIVYDPKPIRTQKPVLPVPPQPMYKPPAYPLPAPNPLPSPPPFYSQPVPQAQPMAVQRKMEAVPMALSSSKAAPSAFGGFPVSAPPPPSLNSAPSAPSFFSFAPEAEMYSSLDSPASRIDSFAAPQALAFESQSQSQPQPPPPVRGMVAEPAAKEMGLAAGGKMKQSIYKDTHGIDTWDENNYARVFVHIVNSTMYRQITGKEPPATPIDAGAYSNFGYPWFDMYDEHVPAVPKSGILSQVKSVSEVDKQKYGYAKQDNSTVNISSSQVHTIVKDQVRDGDW